MKFLQRDITLAVSLVSFSLASQAWGQTGGEDAIQPVGQRPAPSQEAPEIQSIPDIGGVLTPRGRLVIEPEFQYSHSSINRLTFRGVEILSTLLVGALNAEDVDRDSWTAGFTGRLGVTDRLELEMKLPYVYRDETFNLTSPEDSGEGELIRLDQERSGDGLGDVELAAHYQLNRGGRDRPVFVGNLRYKSTTGEGPFDVSRDDDGVEEELATGSGFHSIEPSVTVLIPSDPAVYFANLGYLYNIKDDIDEQITDEITIGEVDPGDAIRLSFGMSYSINPRSSFTLGYKNDFIEETETERVNPETGATSIDSSRTLNVGSMLLGWSYQFSDESVFNLGLELGVTEDAPDTTLTLRAPFGFNVF